MTLQVDAACSSIPRNAVSHTLYPKSSQHLCRNKHATVYMPCHSPSKTTTIQASPRVQPKAISGNRWDTPQQAEAPGEENGNPQETKRAPRPVCRQTLPLPSPQKPLSSSLATQFYFLQNVTYMKF